MIKKGLKVKVLVGKDRNKEGEVIEIDFDYSSCLPATITNYCSIQVKTIPAWKWNGKKLGYYFF